MARSKPHIILSAAASVDGKIATSSGDSALSSKKDQIRVHKLRSRVDAILIGKNTAVCDDPLLTVRLAKGKNPIRIILDSSASIKLDSKILKTCGHIPTIIAVSQSAPPSRLARLGRLPVEIVVAGTKSVSLKLLMRELLKRNVKTILVEGGGTTNWAFIRDGLFDELYLAVSPFIIGGTKSVSLVQGGGFETIKKSARLCLKSTARMGDHVILHYTRILTRGRASA